jgi:hypothetical protein
MLSCTCCGSIGELFGYRDQAGNLLWYCEQHRLAQWWADARHNSSGRAPSVLIPILTANQPPSLQQLVAEHGGFNCISPSAWDRYDAGLREWHRARRVDLVGEGRVVAAETKIQRRARR